MTVIGLCALVIGLLALVLVLHEYYEDGLVGRIALAGVILAAVIVVMSEFDGAKYSAPPELVLLMVSVTAFMGRHVVRFFRWRRLGAHEWRPTKQRLSPAAEGSPEKASQDCALKQSMKPRKRTAAG